MVGTAVRIGVLLALAWLVVALRFGGPETPYLALPAFLADPMALSQAAERALEHARSGDEASAKASRAEAKRLATAALNTSPLASDAIRVLGFVADLEGQPNARKLVETAAARNIRDVQAHVWLVVDDLQRKDYRGALTNLVAMQRVSGSMFGSLLPLMKAVTAQPDGRRALAELLEQAPPWRTPFLQQFAVSEENVDIPAELLTRLAGTKARPTPDEYAPLLRRMVGQGLFDPAYLLWLELMPPASSGEATNIYNGAFDFPPTGSPFDWTIAPATGAWSGITPGGRDGNRQLRVVFNDFSGQFQGASQTVLLSPGEYTLSVKAASDSLASRRGLWWRILCVGGAVLGTTAPVAGTTPGKSLDARFSVPATACPAQVLRLELAARGTLEGAISGEASFDDVAIRRVDESGGR